MSNNAAEVLVGKGKAEGVIWRAAAGTPVPTDANTALDTDFKGLGYVSDSGISQTIDRSAEEIRDMNGNLVRSVQSEFAVSYGLSLLQSANGEALKAYYGDDNVVVTAADATNPKTIAIDINDKELDHAVYVIELFDKTNLGDIVTRYVIADGQPSEVEDVELVGSAAVQLGLTLKAFPDAVGSCVKIYQRIGAPVVTP